MFGIPLRLIALLAGAVALVGMVHGLIYSLKQAGKTECEAAQAKSDKAHRDEREALEQQIAGLQQKIARDAAAANARTNAAIGRAADLANQLRNAIADADRRRDAARAAAAAGSAPAAGEPDLRPDMLREADRRLRALAEEADRRGAAGAACERAYDAMRPGP